MRFVAGLMLAFVTTAAMAEPIPVRLKDGATWMISVEHGRKTDRADKTEAWSVTTVSRVTWKAGAKGAGRLTVTPVSTTPGAGSPPEIAAAATLETPVVVEVDEALTPGRVLNMAELRTSFAAMLKAMDAPANSSSPLPALTDASIMAMATQDLARLALVQGSDLEVGKEVKYEDDVPNPLGGPPIHSLGAFRLESLDRKAARAVIDWRQEFDPQSASRAVVAFVERMMASAPPDKAAEARAVLSTMKLERRDYCRYDVDLRSGLVARVECAADVISGAGAQIARRNDTWTITQTLPEPR